MQQGGTKTQQRDVNTNISEEKYQLLSDIFSYMEENNKNPAQLIQAFSMEKNGKLDRNDFVSLCAQCSNASHLVISLYKGIIARYTRLDEDCLNDIYIKFLLKANRYKVNENQPVLKLRTFSEIFEIIQKGLKQRKTTIKVYFSQYDKNNNKFLNQQEFRNLIKDYVANITEPEFSNICSNFVLPGQQLKDIKITLIALMQQIQDAESLKNSVKLNNVQKPIQLPEPVQQYKPKEPVGSVKKPYTQIVQQVQKEKQQYIQEKPRQINPVLESNIYEDPNQRHILSSDVDFEEYVNLDSATPGLKEFLGEFVKLKKQGKQFKDPKFLCDGNSIGNVKSQKGVQITWQRPEQLWQGNQIGVFMKDIDTSRAGLGKWISPSDIIQGELGDCYILSALSSISCRYPDAILQSFITRSPNPCGMYCVRLCLDGEMEAITIDDYIPVVNGQPIFTSSSQNELWVILLEKALAKVFGSYSNIESGNAREVINQITGCPTLQIFTSDEKFDTQFEGYIKRKCIMTSGSIQLGEKGMTQNLASKLGLLPGHAYSVLKIRDIEHPKLGKIKLLKLRNPWGQKEWSGNWSDKSNLWTPEIMTQCHKNNQKDDGIFFMDLKDFKQYFNDIEIGIYNKDYQYTSQNFVSLKKHAIYLQFDIVRDGEYYISVIQESQRLLRQQYQNYEYSPLRFVLTMQVAPGEYKIINGRNTATRECWVGGLLQKGRYYLYVKVDWNYWQSHDFTIGCYGEQSVKIRSCQKIPNLIRNAYILKAKQSTKRKNYDDPSIWKCNDLIVEEGFGFIYFENQSKDRKLETEVTLKSMQGLKFRKPDRGNKVMLNLQPGQNYCCILTINYRGFQFSLEESYSTPKK